ncbi:MAG TPA: hypothetical protein VM778_10060 [Gemmatimonadota bacterium]|nr:hypothetical protein [Gemmatimonadota bacterium]
MTPPIPDPPRPPAAPLAGPALLAAVALALAACGPARGGADGVPAWPDTLPGAASFGAPRGFTPARAILHLHSFWSHDACDGEPFDPETGEPDLECHARLRAALCAANVDVAYVTDHDRHVWRARSMEEALYHRPGDVLVPAEAGGPPVANRIACAGDGGGVLLRAGSEALLMTIGLDSLPAVADSIARRDWFRRIGPDAPERFRAHGAVVLFPHPEDASLAEIAALGPDLIEVYNPHANFAPKHRESQGLSRLGAIFGLLPFYTRTTPAHPDLALLAIFHANRSAIDRWDALLAAGRRVYGYGASDAHENALPWPMSDGLRGDAYARMIPWVTNALLVPDGDEAARVAALEDAVRAGRFYVTIEAWGTPSGFDFHLETPDGGVEMGGAASFAPGQRLVVEPPRVVLGGFAVDTVAALEPPEVRLRLIRIAPGGGREIVAEGPRPMVHPVDAPGAYRVEVAVVPRHLAPYLGGHAGKYLREVVWIYSNPIFVTAPPVDEGGPTDGARAR